MNGVSKKIDKAKLSRLVVKVLKNEQRFAASKRMAEIEKVKKLKQIIRDEVLDIKNYGGGK